MTAVRYDFTGTVVLVAGGASGIGAATARAVAAAGGRVVVADVNDAQLAAIGAVPNVEAHRVDIADSRAVNALVADVDRRLGRIDAAVLTAAIQRRAPLEEITDADWDRHMGVNLDGVFYAVRALAPIMKRQRKGAIVAFTSGLATLGWPGAAAYAATKAGIVGLFKCAAHELRPYGVRANVLSPGLVATPVFLDAATEDELAMYRRSVGVSEPDAVVPTLLYLISDASANLTGTVLERRLVPGT
jgi:NAD(P)-dependent dehydrogenase (short-subunit alcohol dehydrogenase family)